MRSRDTSPILKVSPKDQETEVPRDTTVLVAAARPIDHLSITGVRVRTEGGEIDGLLDISSDGRILFWRPAQTLDARAEHRVTISGVRDDRGAPFLDHTSTFVTGVFSYIDLEILAE